MKNNELNLKNFNDDRAVFNLLGSLCNDTGLLKDDKVLLRTDDFMKKLHKIIFGAINNITYNVSGDKVTSISPVDIDNYLSAYPTQYKVWNDNNGFEYLQEIVEHSNAETFFQSYDRIKKMAILREYQTIGFDVSDIYEWDSDDFLAREKSLQEIDKMKMKDIFEYFTLKNLRLKDSYDIETDIKQFRAGSGITELLDKAREGSNMGYPTGMGFENSAFGGMKRGKFIIRSAATGGMKTSIAIADMIKVSVPKMYIDGEWKYNGISIPSLFISTELEKEDLDFLALSHITGINRKKITEGHFNMKERELLEEAGRILKESPFYLVHMPDFSVSDIEEIIERHVLDHGVGYVAFDYMHSSSPKLMRTTGELFGQKTNIAETLLYLATRLKAIAEKYDIFLESSTQLNKNRKEDDKKDADAIYGSSAIATKVDVGMLLFRVKDKEREKIADLIEDNGFGKEVNFARYIYKNRSGQPDVILWSHMDMSTIRETPILATDYDYNIIEDIEDLHYEFKEDKTEKDVEKEKEYADGSQVFGEVVVKNEEELDF
ncbi:MAG: hypothetical protein L0K90_05590 [Staphylococcus equorum]|nr:hypothetical protein [Staphylococcus equorum]